LSVPNRKVIFAKHCHAFINKGTAPAFTSVSCHIPDPTIFSFGLVLELVQTFFGSFHSEGRFLSKLRVSVLVFFPNYAENLSGFIPQFCVHETVGTVVKVPNTLDVGNLCSSYFGDNVEHCGMTILRERESIIVRVTIIRGGQVVLHTFLQDPERGSVDRVVHGGHVGCVKVKSTEVVLADFKVST